MLPTRPCLEKYSKNGREGHSGRRHKRMEKWMGKVCLCCFHEFHRLRPSFSLYSWREQRNLSDKLITWNDFSWRLPSDESHTGTSQFVVSSQLPVIIQSSLGRSTLEIRWGSRYQFCSPQQRGRRCIPCNPAASRIESTIINRTPVLIYLHPNIFFLSNFSWYMKFASR